jgi:Cu-Zn family superoxide dismutase
MAKKQKDALASGISSLSPVAKLGVAGAAFIVVVAGAVGVQLNAQNTSQAAKPLAKAALLNTSGVEIGQVVFKGIGTYADRVEVNINAPGVPNPASFHGLHVHTTGVCTPTPSGSTNVPFGSSGGHWNPTGANHGAHVGDLPSPLLTAAGQGYAEFETDRFDVTTLLDAAGDGSAVVLHAGADNFANIPAAYGTPNPATLGTGDAGGRYACGVVKPV